MRVYAGKAVAFSGLGTKGCLWHEVRGFQVSCCLEFSLVMGSWMTLSKRAIQSEKRVGANHSFSVGVLLSAPLPHARFDCEMLKAKMSKLKIKFQWQNLELNFSNHIFLASCPCKGEMCPSSRARAHWSGSRSLLVCFIL